MALTKFQIDRMEENAKRLIICTGCYGVGQREFRDGSCEICKVCNGEGRSAAEPHVLKLIEDLKVSEAKLLDATHVSSDSFHAGQRVTQLEDAIKKFVNQYPWKSGPEIEELAALVEEP